MAYIHIPKDLKTIKSTVFLNLTLRQIVGFTIAGIISIPLYLYFKKSLGNDISIIILLITSFPILFITFYEKNGIKAEYYLKNIFIFRYYNPQKRLKKEKYIEILKKRKESEKQTRK